MCDGTVRFLTNGLSQSMFALLGCMNDGVALDATAFD
jgi:hypothetical protein